MWKRFRRAEEQQESQYAVPNILNRAPLKCTGTHPPQDPTLDGPLLMLYSHGFRGKQAKSHMQPHQAFIAIFPAASCQTRPSNSPCVTTLPKTGRVSSVEQFQRRLRNWYWHSSMASWAPRRTESITSRFLLHICTWRWIKPFSFSQVSSSEMLPTEDSFARYLPGHQHNRLGGKGWGSPYSSGTHV